ncbi:jacalin-related lectin 3-like [Rosa rugosa]|uniref:jacalin-related lectin 3-like n=1 Tax=Rosa rugosa TaxID=74645 RepID=UPI002B4013D7|nr:jacalin-related lectin 3-like [Rosa rugosa]
MSLKDYSGEKILLKLGPFGSERGGKGFDDGAHSTVRQLVISHSSKSNINFLQIEYDDNGSSFWSDKHGVGTGSDPIDEIQYDGNEISYRTDTIKLDYPYEYLISVHGTYFKFWPSICSLTFRSNKKSYGPYGNKKSYGPYDEGKQDKYFSIQPPGNMIVGFHGRACEYMGICAIGAYLKPIDHHYQNKKYNLDVMPALPKPSNPLRQARYPSQTNLRNKQDDGDDDKQSTYTIAGNQVNGNEGDRNGNFVVGNNINIIYILHPGF